MQETWKPVVGLPSFQVSDLGNVRHDPFEVKPTKRGRPWKSGNRAPSRSDPNKPITVNLSGRSYVVHSLVAAAFLGERPVGAEIKHKNGNLHDNRADNLCYRLRTNALADEVAQYNAPVRVAEEPSGSPLG